MRSGLNAMRYTLSAILTITAGSVMGAQGAPGTPPAPGPRAGYTPADAVVEAATEERATAIPSPTTADSYSRVLSHEPHVAGTPAQARTRDYVIGLMKSWGLETEVRAYDIYMPHPSAVRVWLLSPSTGVNSASASPAGTSKPGPSELRFAAADGMRMARDSEELSLPEGPVPGDSTSSAYPQVLTYNGYSASGTAAGELVYVNYGLIEDYAHLDSVGVSVSGKIVIARYGHSFRGIKAREAERHGAAGLLIYSDPADDGYVRGDVYPEGPMRPSQGVQRGSIMNDDGDPSTPGYPSTAGARRLEPSQMALPKIPVIPISYGNATRLLQFESGSSRPARRAPRSSSWPVPPSKPRSATSRRWRSSERTERRNERRDRRPRRSGGDQSLGHPGRRCAQGRP
jgi:N-acetylated-alpha-linked acidic dipeptidase